MGQTGFMLSFAKAYGEQTEAVIEKIKTHIKTDHYLKPGSMHFGKLQYAHMAACIRNPDQYSEDDAELHQLLDLPTVVFDRNLSPKT